MSEVTTHPEKLVFQAEVKQVLNMMVNSLYANQEVFLRELISNASDACEKYRFQTYAAESALPERELLITIAYDKEAKTLTITDNGIGMSYQDVVQNIGTIAHSGTKKFLEACQQNPNLKDNLQQIGQFGVGFYSVFIVADHVDIFTRHAALSAEEGVHWSSDGQESYEISTMLCEQSGTTVVLHFKDESAEEFLSHWKIRSLIKKYAEHIQIPIQMRKEEWDEESKSQRLTDQWETINASNALWTRDKSGITAQEYQDFYKSLTGDIEEPLVYAHHQVEGRLSYIQLLYLPSKAAFDLWEPSGTKRGLKLYVQRVFIRDNIEELLPLYLRFVKGVVDCSDLALNVSREVLQNNRDLKVLKDGCTKRVLGMLSDLFLNEEKYRIFWKQFGAVLKEGMAEDFVNREKIASLILFPTSNTQGPDDCISLDTYIERMSDHQDKIYYCIAESYTAVSSSPHLELFKKKGIDVLFLFDRVDEWWLSYLTEYKGKKFQSVSKGDVSEDAWLTEEEKGENDRSTEDNKALLDAFRSALADYVKDVRISLRLVDSPTCLVFENNEAGAHLQRLMKAMNQSGPEVKPILEINPKHCLINRLDLESGDFTDWAFVLFQQALLSEGAHLQDPALFVKKMNELMIRLSLS